MGLGQQHAGFGHSLDLIANPADPARDDRARFHIASATVSPKPSAKALLEDHTRVALQSVDNRGVLLDILHRQRAEVHPPTHSRRQLMPRRPDLVENLGASGSSATATVDGPTSSR